MKNLQLTVVITLEDYPDYGIKRNIENCFHDITRCILKNMQSLARKQKGQKLHKVQGAMSKGPMVSSVEWNLSNL